MQQKGNNVLDDSLLSLLLVLKQNVMSSTHVADIVRVIQDNSDGTYICCRFDDDSEVIDAIALEEMSPVVGDICLVLYCDHDFRLNLKKLKLGSSMVENNSNITHSLNYGVLIGNILQVTRSEEE